MSDQKAQAFDTKALIDIESTAENIPVGDFINLWKQTNMLEGGLTKGFSHETLTALASAGNRSSHKVDFVTPYFFTPVYQSMKAAEGHAGPVLDIINYVHGLVIFSTLQGSQCLGSAAVVRMVDKKFNLASKAHDIELAWPCRPFEEVVCEPLSIALAAFRNGILKSVIHAMAMADYETAAYRIGNDVPEEEAEAFVYERYDEYLRRLEESPTFQAMRDRFLIKPKYEEKTFIIGEGAKPLDFAAADKRMKVMVVDDGHQSIGSAILKSLQGMEVDATYDTSVRNINKPWYRDFASKGRKKGKNK